MSKKNQEVNEIAKVVEEVTVATDETVEIKSAFEDAINSGQDEDSIKMAMIGAGATFKNVTRLYNQLMIDSGLAVSKEERSQIVEDTLAGRSFESEEDFNSAVSALVSSITGATDRSASALVRAYAKKNEVEAYKKPKAEGTGGTRNPFVTTFHEALVANPDMTEQDLRDLIGGLDPEHQVNPMRWFGQHNNIRKTVNSVSAKFK